MTVVGTRPEIIRLSAVIHKLEASASIKHILVHTGQNYDYELNEIFFKELELRTPDYYLNAATQSAIETIGNILIQIEPILEKEKPDALLILGDTNSCLCAIAAKRKQIPIFHMEAGNRCFDQRVPEETNRRIVDHISDINLPYSDIAREYLLREGIPADRIIKLGSPMYEVIHEQRKKIVASDVLERLALKEKEYFLISTHREENINSDKNFNDLTRSIQRIAETYRLPVIVSTHPRTRKKMEEENMKFHPLIQFLKPFGFHDYIKLQLNAKAVLSDSGTISEEASILGIKALNLRQAQERPEAMEEASVMLVGLTCERILQSLDVLLKEPSDSYQMVPDYIIPNVSRRCAQN